MRRVYFTHLGVVFSVVSLFANTVNAAQGDYVLNLSSGPGGRIALPGEGVFTYRPGVTVTVVAVAEPNYHFSHWSGTAAEVVESTTHVTSLTMREHLALRANFSGTRTPVEIRATAGGVLLTPGRGATLCLRTGRGHTGLPRAGVHLCRLARGFGGCWICGRSGKVDDNG